MKKLVSVMMAGALALSLAACGGSSAPAGAGSTAAEGSTDTIVVNIWDTSQQEGLRQIADEWSAKTGIDVRIDVVA